MSEHASRSQQGRLSAAIVVGVLAVVLLVVVAAVGVKSVAPPAPAAAESAGRQGGTEARDALRDAAVAYSLGDLAAARAALARRPPGAQDEPLTAALELAIRREAERQSAARDPLSARPNAGREPAPPSAGPPAATTPLTPTPATRSALPPPAPAPAPPAISPPQADRQLPAPPSADEREAVRRQVAELDELARSGDFDLLKRHPLVQAAFVEARKRVEAELGVADASSLAFPDPLTTAEVFVRFDDGVLTIRGLVDQWNVARRPVRMLYLTRLRPLGPERFEHLGTTILR
ncbi:MAG: hypothetical protein ACK4PI_12790 [Tepidisphaerales bacterium]